MEKTKHFFWFQFPAIAWAAAIFIQSSLSDISAPELGFDMQDKVYHAIEYAILGFLLVRALRFQQNLFLQKHAGWLTFLIGSVYAISDEIHQMYVPGRMADASDAIADVVGVALVLITYFLIIRIRSRGKSG